MADLAATAAVSRECRDTFTTVVPLANPLPAHTDMVPVQTCWEAPSDRSDSSELGSVVCGHSDALYRTTRSLPGRPPLERSSLYLGLRAQARLPPRSICCVLFRRPRSETRRAAAYRRASGRWNAGRSTVWSSRSSLEVATEGIRCWCGSTADLGPARPEWSDATTARLKTTSSLSFGISVTRDVRSIRSDRSRPDRRETTTWRISTF